MKPEYSSIPIGKDFLPQTSASYLLQLHKKEKDSTVALRLMAYILRKKSKPILDICTKVNRSYSTVRDWLVKAVKYGIKGRYNIKQKGTESRLDESQLKQLSRDLTAGPEKCGFESGVWTARLITKHVKRKFGVEYALPGMYHVLERINASWRTPRPEHPKSATKEQQNEFKKKLNAVSDTTKAKDTSY